MIYLVSKNKRLYSPEKYSDVPFEEAMSILEPLKEVQIDTETLGLDCHTKALLTLQLGCTENQVVFDWTTLTNDEIKVLKEYLESDRLFIGHNLMFDLTFLYKQDIWLNHIYDTMIGEQLIYLGYPRIISKDLTYELNMEFPDYELVYKTKVVKDTTIKEPYYELSYSLKATANRRIHVDIDKTVRGKIINDGLTEDVVVYAGGDVMWLERIKEEQLKELANQDLLKAMQFECEFVKSLAYVKYCGVHLDAIKWQEKMDNDQRLLNEALNELNQFVLDLDAQEYIYRYTNTNKDRERVMELGFERYPEGDNDKECWRYYIKGLFVIINLQHSLFEEYEDSGTKCNINWSSSKQVIKLFELLGVKVKTFDKKTKKEKKSIEENIIAPQANDFPIISIFLRYQAAAKVVSTYGQNWLNAINPKTGRVHVELHSIGTDTSRLSSGGGPYKLNQQNLPHDAITRACFTAEKGNKWISCDYSGQESCLTASVSQDTKMCEILNTGGDLHSEVAKACWPELLGNLTDKEVKSQYKEYRQNAKGVEFGIFYGGDDNTLVANKGFTKAKAKSIYNNFMNTFSGIKRYQDYCRRAVMDRGYILMNPVFKHRAHIFDAEWLFKMQEKFKEPGFWQYYNEMKETTPSCDTVRDVQKYFRRKSDSERQSINYRIQNRGACCFKLAMIKFFNWIKANNYLNIVKICTVVHDEINLECPEAIAGEVGDILVKCMIAGGKPFCPNVYLGADVTIDDHWIH
jgi:DNA polymerase I-like protein with 3'-5' exonuclease and polymerase domains